MAKAIKTIYQDILGRDIKADDYVSAIRSNSLVIAKVLKLTPKMLSLQMFNKSEKFNRYPAEVTLLLPLDDVLFYILKHKRHDNV
jgi:hypothetical protein